jgi:hypothetical protein
MILTPALAVCLLMSGDRRPAAPLFSDADRAAAVAYWSMPSRLQVTTPPDVTDKGVWRVHLTPEGSLWLWKYQNAIGASKAPPTQDPVQAPVPVSTAIWKTWVDARIAYDRFTATNVANSLNASLKLPAQPVTAIPPDPGPIPTDLLAAVGDPPRFASVVTPVQATIAFDDGTSYAYIDNVPIRPAYAYYRFPQGTVSYGKKVKDLPQTDLQTLFNTAGFSPSEQRIAMAVSALEGGFDSINTYDTGFVSVGFLQFTTGAEGHGSLLEVMAREKQEQPAQFRQDFQRLGIDVTPDGYLDCVDPRTGAEVWGSDAVQLVIGDKRLTSAFEHAGATSLAFRVAQVEVAKAHYWPTDDPINVTINGQACRCKVCDIIHSEAGIATLFDRKVNRGTIEPVSQIVSQIIAAHRLATVYDAARYEKAIIAALKYRADYLKNRDLSQPDSNQNQQPVPPPTPIPDTTTDSDAGAP